MTPPATSGQRSTHLERLRAAMRHHRIDALVVPSSDPHLSEYLPERWKGREWLSGFTGSVGTLIVTHDGAGVWTDARYWTQAEAELAGSGIALHKTSSGASLQHIDWLAAHLKRGHTVAVDAQVLALASARLMADALHVRGINLLTDVDLLDTVWTDRPTLPKAPVYEHKGPYVVINRVGKLAATRAAMAKLGATHHFISTLDDIAWLFNLRGADVSYNPVFLAHALIGPQGATLFVGDGKISPELRQRLMQQGVEVARYGEAGEALSDLDSGAVLLLDPRRVTAGMRAALDGGIKVIEAINPSTIAKSRKDDTEAVYVRSTMEQDGAALCEFFAWLEQQLADPLRAPLTESMIDGAITEARARRPGFVSPSFATIAGFNANGAVIHYRAQAGTDAVIEGDGLLLIDSGGQYLGGTTDITRMVAVGTPSAAQRRDCTLVLRGLIALSAAQFPRATRAPMLDALARAPIWAAGIDYGHGTGHGVGFFLNVHEGPQSISATAMPEPQTAMEQGMITSIEPGIYRPGRWGVRFENLVLNQSAGLTEFGEFLRFETLTLCPIDVRCIDPDLLHADERAWLNDYHALVRTRLAPHVSGAAAHWLERTTEAI
ncbi:aminopeptidase P family protein [Massilia sp. CF038]|uniref:aminopeptidase P family protein n=1 Tax=Massilia sp. CF038 TaxID=1881045 RepID=UPI000915BE5F|nr:aminopeptidase P family protein [Massilia sp. CF038]SHH42969.1 Xaa-Pro aminopeptidase [Massilia sp. CF038]